jgi:Mce-associated membrane protein
MRETTKRRVPLAAAALAALAFCGYAGHDYWHSHHGGDASFATTRDAALADGTRDIAGLSSMDGSDTAHIDAGLAAWLSASTGALHDELSRDAGQNRAALDKAGTTVRSTVTDAALTELDTRAGTAKLIATVQVVSTPRGGAPTTDRKRFEAGLAHTSAGWKLTALTAVAAGAA